MGGSLAIWAVLCLAIAAVLFFVEIFVPSGGIIGFASAAALIAGIIMLFKIDTTLGLIGAILALLALPFLFIFALRLWPDTPIARMLTLKNPERSPGEGDAAETGAPAVAAGTTGKALTDLRPVGTCLFDGRRCECLAEGGVIRAGTAVRVVWADGLQIKVREQA